MLDLVIRHSTVVDGTGAPEFPADLGIVRDRIAVVGRIGADVPAAQVIDGTGLVTAPGFVDIHTHSDVNVIRHPDADSKLLQGVTTEVTGNCGFSPFPVAAEPRVTADHMARVPDVGLLVPDWSDAVGYLDAVRRARPLTNVAPLVGHGALRLSAMGHAERPPDESEQEVMRRRLRDAMQAGCWGMSTGLTWSPSSYADPAEITDLAGIVAHHGGLYATHARVYGDNEFGAVDEAIGVAHATGVRVQLSHAALNNPDNWGAADRVLAAVDRAATAAADVSIDVYPYAASGGSLPQFLPDWVQQGGEPGWRSRLSDPGLRDRVLADIRRGWYRGIPWRWDRFTIARSSPADASAIGRTLAEVALRTGRSPAEAMIDLCLSSGDDLELVVHSRDEADVRAFLGYPNCAIGSDGSALPVGRRAGRPHPRTMGTFPRVLGRYVRAGVLDLPEAVRRCTRLPAERVGIPGRGVLRPGSFADLVVFDPARIADVATFADPWQPPRGIRHVLVNGVWSVRDGVRTGDRGGRVLIARR
jgi:N-acyl-D-aspartate/D-glutamate deacylase